MKIVSERLGKNGCTWLLIECDRPECNKTREDRRTRLVQSDNHYCGEECYRMSLRKLPPIGDVTCIKCGVLVKGPDREYTNRSTASKQCIKCRRKTKLENTVKGIARRVEFKTKWDQMVWS